MENMKMYIFVINLCLNGLSYSNQSSSKLMGFNLTNFKLFGRRMLRNLQNITGSGEGWIGWLVPLGRGGVSISCQRDLYKQEQGMLFSVVLWFEVVNCSLVGMLQLSLFWLLWCCFNKVLFSGLIICVFIYSNSLVCVCLYL